MAKIKMMALRHSAFYAPYLMTISGGYLTKLGLEPEYLPQTPDNLVADAFRENRCDVSQSAVAASFADFERNIESNVVHFAQINERDGFFMTSREPCDNFQWSQLAGQEVLIDHFFQPYAMLNYGLHKAGINIKDLCAVDAGNVEEMDRAFRSGKGQYIHQQGPAPQQLQADGIGHIVGAVGDLVGPVAFSSICAKRQWLDTEMAQAFMQAYREARQFVIEAPANDIAKLISHHLPDISLPVLTTTIATYQTLGCWSGTTEITSGAYQTLLDVFMHNGDISGRHPMDKFVQNI